MIMAWNDIDASLSSEGPESSTHSSWSSDSSSAWDDWPADFDGTGLFESLDRPDEPAIFRFDVRRILDEVEEHVGSSVVDIPKVGKGSNYFGMHMRLANTQDILVRMARCDVNWPRRAGISELVEQEVFEAEFEAKIYELLRPHRKILTPSLLYWRAPSYRLDALQTIDRSPPQDTLGRAFFVFEKAEGVNNVWPDDVGKRFSILEQCARIRAALFSFTLPPDFVASWLMRRSPAAKSIPVDIAPTRDFVIPFLAAKIDEVIPDEGGFIGFEEDHNVVGPVALKAKNSLLQLLPWILPPEADPDLPSLYRLVLEHGDFGIHNMTITDAETPSVTSLYDWETGHIVPAILSDPQISVYVDLELDPEGEPMISRVWEGISEEDWGDCMRCAEHYFQVLGEEAPEYMAAIKAGRDARRIWFALTDWRGDDAEQYFGTLGSWAEERLSHFVAQKSEIQ
ncbi:hypothetical protein MVEN_02616900 [Mycena venus]|uniref:Aminoglycoside phosphotransferase domain-containing protein n=1 Tax=Mycena venus TaxID=2733690 RepID=A0A8H6TYF8_9AGAR|nr:hypothetical protein MVEN_02616900 [Mycena venus]